jgi:hypothetical protein
LQSIINIHFFNSITVTVTVNPKPLFTMKFSLTLLANGLFAATTLAAPQIGKLARRATDGRVASIAQHSPFSPPKSPLSPDVSSSQVIDFFTNWSGLVQTLPTGTTSPFVFIQGTFVIPTPTPPTSSGDGQWRGAAWVGIDGFSDGNALLQAGVAWEVDRTDGVLSYIYDAWVEWIPLALQPIVPSLTVTAGDEITVIIKTLGNGNSSGTIVIENITTGQSSVQTLDAPSSSADLEGLNAEWIVEDLTVGSGLSPFANFNSVTFTNCLAATANGAPVTLTGAIEADIVDANGNAITSITPQSASEFTDTYI